MPQEVFARAVKRVLPSAIPTHLERIDEYAVGKVLIYSKTPRKLFPLRKQQLDFTGYSLQSLLAKGEELTISHARSYLFDTEKSTFSKSVKVDVAGDFDLESALVRLASADAKFNFKAGEHKTLTITTDFGKITHISTDLVNSAVSGQIQVQPDHPIVKKAIENGGVMFVISTIYEGDRCKVGVTASDETSESGGASGDVAKEKVEGSQDTDDRHHSSKVISRDQPTPLAYLVLKVAVNSKGVVTTQLNTRLSDKLQGKKAKKSWTKPTSIPSAASPSSDPYDEWVVIEVETLKTPEGDTKPLQAPPQSSEQPVPVTEVAECEPTSQLEAAAPSGKAEQNASEQSEISHPYPAPISEIATAKIDTPLGSAPGTSPKQGTTTEPVPISGKPEQPDGMPDEHYLYSLKDFQPFQSTTYLGILDEAKNWVKPFVSNGKLQEAFLTYTKPPRTYERLNDLSAYFLELGNSLRSGGPAPTNKPKDVDMILDVLSANEDQKMNECSAVIVVAEAADEFPQHILRKIVELSSDKKKILKDLILSTPYAHSRHVFAGEGPFRDPELKSIMQRMGYSIPMGTRNLLHSHTDSDEEEDKLSAGLILLLATEKN